MLKSILFETYRENKNNFGLKIIKNFMVNISIYNRDKHGKLFKYLNKQNDNVSKFYLAKLLVYYGEYEKANMHLDLECVNEFHPEALYLKAYIYYRLNKTNDLKLLLEKDLLVTKRKKSWILFCSYCGDKISTETLLKIYNSINGTIYKKNDSIILHYLVHSLLQNNEFELADRYLENSEIGFKSNVKNSKKSYFTRKDAQRALLDFKYVLDKFNIKFFLVSGTFLGCIREKNIIKHDYDLDIGVFDNLYNIEKAILNEGYFKILFINKYILKVQHLNGIHIDVFYHYKKNGLIYHNSRYDVWWNSNFRLKEYLFLGKHFLGPDDYNKYLTENYGLWQKPNLNFSNLLDTPNLLIDNKERYIILLKMLLSKDYGVKNRDKILAKIKFEKDR